MPRRIKPLRGKAFMQFLRKCAETVDRLPHWMKGERKPKNGFQQLSKSQATKRGYSDAEIAKYRACINFVATLLREEGER